MALHIEIRIPSSPDTITADELKEKLVLCRAVLEAQGKKGILLVQEGAMRWLTGYRNQIADIRAGDPSPVQALLVLNDSGWVITFITDSIEMVRIREQFPGVYENVGGVSIHFITAVPGIDDGISKPGDGDYLETVGKIVRPMVGGFNGNQYMKFQWLSRAATALLARSAHELEVGMNGSRVKGLLSRNFYDAGVESNLFLVALAGQERHLHPLYHERYRIEKNGWVKLVCGARFADMIYSATAMVKMGNPMGDELAWYRTLQQAIVEYADCYRNGALEGEIYDAVGGRFAAAGKDAGLDGFGESAYLHHLGGPTSPLGNRDFIIQKGGARSMFPWMQFAVNPVEKKYGTKCELQGIIMPQGAPHVPDAFAFVPAGAMSHRICRASGGTECAVADIIVR